MAIFRFFDIVYSIMPGERRIIFKNINLTSQKEVITIKDIEDILKLDKTHWTTTGVSVDAINCDPVFLHYLDFDKNRRIMCFEVKAAIQWLFTILQDRRGIVDGSFVLKLAAINSGHKEGQELAVSASQALTLLVKESRELSLEEVRRLKVDVEKTPISGAGVVLPDASSQEPVREFLTDIIRTVGGVTHPAGEQGVNQEKLNEFVSQAQAYLNWFNRKGMPGKAGKIKSSKTAAMIRPLGDNTEKAFVILDKLRGKVNEYFLQCQLANYMVQMKLSGSIGGQPVLSAAGHGSSEAPIIGEKSSSGIPVPQNQEDIIRFLMQAPLAEPNPGCVLDFRNITNGYFEDDMRSFAADLVQPVLGREKKTLTRQEWLELQVLFREYEQWQTEKQGEVVAAVSIANLEKYLAGDYVPAVQKLIEISRENALVLDEIRMLEKLILFQALIVKFLNNFVYFPYLYDPNRRALFEMGTLIMDGRKFTLSVKVEEHSRHVDFSRKSNMFILYVNVLSAENVKYEVAVPVTHGRKGNLYIGKRGIFQDIHQQDWDAVVTDIIENPISLTEALVTPFQKLSRLITSKIEELKNAAESKLDVVVKETKITGIAPPAAQKTPGNAGMGGLFMGSGIAIAALGSALAFITKTFSEVKWYTVLMTISGAFMAVLLPTFITAFHKLRKRDLSAILEASGWAVNVRMNLTLRLGKFFTQKPPLSGIMRRWKILGTLLVVIIVISLIILLFLFRHTLFPFLFLKDA